MLEVEDLSFRWSLREGPLLSGLRFLVEEGEVLGVLGANGAGKSTLLGLIGGRLGPESGAVLLNGAPPSPLRINYMLQDSDRQLFAHLTLAQNIDVGGRSARKDSIVDALFEERGSLARFPSQCSGGQRQRAVLARSLADIFDFPISLLDEPFARLSVDARKAARTLLVDGVRESCTPVVVVSHDVPETVILADRVLVLGQHGGSTFDTGSITSEEALQCERDLLAEVMVILMGIGEAVLTRRTGKVD